MASKSSTMQFLEKTTGGPLTFGRMLQSIRLGEEQTLARWAELPGYSQTQFVRLAQQSQLDQAGLDLHAQVTNAREHGRSTCGQVSETCA